MPPHRPEALAPGSDQAFMYAARNIAATAIAPKQTHARTRTHTHIRSRTAATIQRTRTNCWRWPTACCTSSADEACS
jgi:hypothetical protein